MIRQNERAECGLACLASVSAFYGQHLSLAELRKEYGSSASGMSLARIAAVAVDLGFSTRALRLELEGLLQLKTPAILHWDLEHFVVLLKAGRRSVVVHDPAKGRVSLSVAEASRYFTGVALELSPTPNLRRVPRARSLSLARLITATKGLSAVLALVFVLSLCLQLVILAGPFLLQWVVDQVLPSADASLLVTMAVGFVALTLFQAAALSLRGWTLVHISSQLNVGWASAVFSKLLKLPISYFEKRSVGDVASRLASIQSIQRILTTNFVEAVIDGLMSAVTLTVMFLYSKTLAILSIVVVSTYVTARVLTLRKVAEATESQLVLGATQNSYMLETVRGMQAIKLSGAEVTRQEKFANLIISTTNQEVRLARLKILFDVLNTSLLGVERILVICIGAAMVLDGTLSLGMLMAYLAYKDLFSSRFPALVDKWTDFKTAQVHADRVEDILIEEGEFAGHASSPEARSGSSQEGVLRLVDVEYSYERGVPVLRGVSLDVAPGEVVAIVGRSGAGKTTLIKIMLGLLTPSGGDVIYGGVTLKGTSIRGFRASVGTVMQDDQMFAGSVAENIAFGCRELDLERVVEAAKLARVHEDIERLPLGYDSQVGDMGSTFSGGQKQRVILARAIYRRPRVLFLDEATSHLDVQLERDVNAAVRSLGCTVIIVAHRPETIASADRVLVLDSGRVTENQAATVPV